MAIRLVSVQPWQETPVSTTTGESCLCTPSRSIRATALGTAKGKARTVCPGARAYGAYRCVPRCAFRPRGWVCAPHLPYARTREAGQALHYGRVKLLADPSPWHRRNALSRHATARVTDL